MGVEKLSPVDLERDSRRTGLLLLAAVTLFWGLNWAVMKAILNELPVWTFRAICLLSGGGGMLLIARLQGLSLRIPEGQWRPLLFVTLFNVPGWYIFSAYGLARMGAGRASILGFTMPLWATLLSALVLRERLSFSKVCGLLLGLLGLALLVMPNVHAIAKSPLGIIFMLCAAMCWAIGTVGFRYFQWTAPTAVLTGWQLLLGGIPVVLGAAFVDGTSGLRALSPRSAVLLIYSISLPILLCQWAWFKVVKIFPASVASIGTLAIPVIGIVSGALWLGEMVGAAEILALVLVCCALAIVLIFPTLAREKRPKNG